jgi:hypothetical protein
MKFLMVKKTGGRDSALGRRAFRISDDINIALNGKFSGNNALYQGEKISARIPLPSGAKAGKTVTVKLKEQ